MKRRIVALTLCLALLGAMAINYSGCTLRVAAKELTEGYAPGEVPARAADDAFIDAQLSLAASLFRTVAADERGGKRDDLAPFDRACPFDAHERRRR